MFRHIDLEAIIRTHRVISKIGFNPEASHMHMPGHIANDLNSSGYSAVKNQQLIEKYKTIIILLDLVLGSH